MGSAAQLVLLEAVAPPELVWAGEGRACRRCDDGVMVMAEPSDPCQCAEAICVCLAEGYAVCDACGSLEQVWPREMVVHPRR